MNELFDDYRDRFQNWVADLHFSSLHKRALLAIALLVCAVSVAVVFRGHSEPIAIPEPIVVAPPKVTVDIAGGVNSPGVYSLPANSRVIDAITAAGDAKPGTDLSDINLARIVKDGEQIYVDPSIASIKSEPIARSAGVATPIRKKTGPININRATASDFDTLPGIGPVLAARILNYRKANGPFTAIEDLQKVSGIGTSKFADLKSKVRV
ncbi:MAG TPA: ComEA family DNA-binding protein [Candidatus Nanopelagicaceae bacterium]